MLGGRTESSPTSPAATTAPSSWSSLMCTPGCGRPTAPTFSGWARASDAVEQLQVGRVGMEDRLGVACRAGRPLDERGVGVAPTVALEHFDTAGPNEGDGTDGTQRASHFGVRRALVDRDEHGAGQPGSEHGRDHLGAVPELDGDRITGLDPDGSQPL